MINTKKSIARFLFIDSMSEMAWLLFHIYSTYVLTYCSIFPTDPTNWWPRGIHILQCIAGLGTNCLVSQVVDKGTNVDSDSDFSPRQKGVSS